MSALAQEKDNLVFTLTFPAPFPPALLTCSHNNAVRRAYTHFCTPRSESNYIIEKHQFGFICLKKIHILNYMMPFRFTKLV